MSRVYDFIKSRSNFIGVFQPSKCGKDKHDFQSYYKIHGNEAIVCVPETDALDAVRFARKEERFIMLDTGLLGEKAIQDFLKQSKDSDKEGVE